MNITKYGIIFLFLVIIFTVSLFGGHIGFKVDGVPQGGDITDITQERHEGFWWNVVYFWHLEGVADFLTVAWNGMSFLFNMLLFRIDGMPVVFSAIFWIMSFMVLIVIVSLARGTA
jgi:hypothetical protein